jgi:uncharacterized protein YodC (DUF2158 family)
MHLFRLGLLAAAVIVFSGCTEVKEIGDAKSFQTSATGSIIMSLVGLSLVLLGIVAFVGSVWPDKKPKNRRGRSNEGLSVAQRVGLAIFGFSMGFMGLALVGISFLFAGKLHVTVYPDRVEMASTFSQTGGRERVIPFSNLSKVEIRDERSIVGKLRPYIVFEQKDGSVVMQEAGNNERQALETIRQALAAYQLKAPATPNNPQTAQNTPQRGNRGPLGDSTASGSIPRENEMIGNPTANAPTPRFPAATSSSSTSSSGKEYSFKRYVINIPIPPDHALVTTDEEVQVGTKLKACFAGSWYSVTVVETNNDGTITCNWDDWRSYTYKMVREDLIIPKSGATITATDLGSTQYTLKRYKIDIPLPPGHSVLEADTRVTVGMKLGACYAGHWESVTVVAVNADGTVTCSWDEWTGFTYKMMREDLTIKNR